MSKKISQGLIMLASISVFVPTGYAVDVTVHGNIPQNVTFSSLNFVPTHKHMATVYSRVTESLSEGSKSIDATTGLNNTLTREASALDRMKLPRSSLWIKWDVEIYNGQEIKFVNCIPLTLITTIGGINNETEIEAVSKKLNDETKIDVYFASDGKVSCKGSM